MKQNRRLAILVLVGMSLAAPALAGDPACEDQCFLDYWACSDACGPFGGATCEANCTAGFNACIAGCACPTIRDYTLQTSQSKTATGRIDCFKDPLTAKNRTFVEFHVVDGYTTYRETTFCGGSTSTVVLSTFFVPYDCWSRLSTSFCTPASPTPSSICSF
jgi:hypothetical protein